MSIDRRGSGRRRAATFVEILVAAAVLSVVLGSAWYFFVVAQKGARQVLQYGSVIQAAAAVQARLQMDLAASFVPPGLDLDTPAFQLRDQGHTLGFLRTARVQDFDGVDPRGPELLWVEWRTEDGPGGTRILVRDMPGVESQEWRDAPLQDLRFSLVKQDDLVYAVAEMIFVDSQTAVNTATGRRGLPLRVVRCLRPPARIRRGGIPFPEDLLGPLPAPAGAPPSLLPQDDVGVQLSPVGGA